MFRKVTNIHLKHIQSSNLNEDCHVSPTSIIRLLILFYLYLHMFVSEIFQTTCTSSNFWCHDATTDCFTCKRLPSTLINSEDRLEVLPLVQELHKENLEQMEAIYLPYLVSQSYRFLNNKKVGSYAFRTQ